MIKYKSVNAQDFPANGKLVDLLNKEGEEGWMLCMEREGTLYFMRFEAEPETRPDGIDVFEEAALAMWRQGRRFAAIKYLREHTNRGLKESRDWLEENA